MDLDLSGKTTEKRKLLEEINDCEEDDMEMSGDAPKTQLEHEKRLRRVIANSNERRRMQSINAGFQCLRALIPNAECEKLSKAAILHQTGDHIHELEREKTRLLSQNTQLKQMIRELSRSSSDVDIGSKLSPPPKRKKRDTESSDEGISMSCDDFSPEELKREMIEIRSQLDRERRLRIMLEEQKRYLESQLYPERLQQIVKEVHETKLEPEPIKKQPIRVEQKPVMTPPVKPVIVESAPVRTPVAPAPPLLCNPVSRRNLETIVEAIRHLEGDSLLLDGLSSLGNKCLPKDSGCSSGSDQEDCKSESSGSGSPLHRTDDVMACTSAASLLNLRQERHHPTMTSTVTVTGESSDRYPSATVQLLHPTVVAPSVPRSPIHHHPHFIPRPAVIVQKSS